MNVIGFQGHLTKDVELPSTSAALKPAFYQHRQQRYVSLKERGLDFN